MASESASSPFLGPHSRRWPRSAEGRLCPLAATVKHPSVKFQIERRLWSPDTDRSGAFPARSRRWPSRTARHLAVIQIARYNPESERDESANRAIL